MSDSDKDKENPFEEIQKQLQSLLKGGNLPAGFPISSNISQSGQPGGAPPVEPEEDPKVEETLRRIREFNLKPKEIRDYLDRFVVRQETAKKVLSVAICDHYNHVRQCLENPKLQQQEYQKQNILLLGPTGVGKTYLMRTIAKLIGVPFVKADATKFSETGYVGADVEDLVRDLVKSAGGNVDLAEYGIIYIDEIDKIASEGGGGKDVSGRGVQINLLKLMEETEVSPFGPNDIMSQMQMMMGGRSKKGQRAINTRHILFIVSGAFDKLAETVKKRVSANTIGFAAASRGDDDELVSHYLHQVETRDLIKYGFEPEFIGRLPVRVACNPLAKLDLQDILLSSEGSILKQYKSDFKGHGIDFTMTPEALESIAERAERERTGARGLMTVLERIFRDYKFELPSTAIREFEVTAETIERPEEDLKSLLEKNAHLQEGVFRLDIDRFAETFSNEHGLKIEFTDDACRELSKISVHRDKTVRSICEEQFKDFQHGLKIISRNTGMTSFVIDGDCAKAPDKVLSQWVVRSFREKEQNTPPAEGEEDQ